MASGLEYHEDPYSHPIYGVADRLQFALGPALVHEPGQRYNYSNGDASIADAVVAAAAGTDLLSYGSEVLFAPLGFKNVEWWFRDKAGRYPGGWGLRLTRHRHGQVRPTLSAEGSLAGQDHHRGQFRQGRLEAKSGGIALRIVLVAVGPRRP